MLILFFNNCHLLTILKIQKCLSTKEEQREDFLEPLNKGWTYTRHRLNTGVPVCMSTVCDEQLEFTCTVTNCGHLQPVISAVTPEVEEITHSKENLTFFLILPPNS